MITNCYGINLVKIDLHFYGTGPLFHELHSTSLFLISNLFASRVSNNLFISGGINLDRTQLSKCVSYKLPLLLPRGRVHIPLEKLKSKPRKASYDQAE